MTEWLSKQLNKNTLEEYHLRIVLHQSFFALGVSSLNKAALIAYAHIPCKWNFEVFDKEEFLSIVKSSGIPFSKKYARVSFVFHHQYFTLFPASLDLPEINQSALGLNCAIEGSSVLKNNMPQQNINVLFAVHTPLYDWLKKHFPGANFKHHACVAAKYFFNFTQAGEQHKVFMQKDGQELLVVIYKGQQLLWNNAYQVHHENDILYFLSAVLQDLTIPPNGMQLYVFGKLTQEKNTTQLLQNYFPEMHLLSTPAELAIPMDNSPQQNLGLSSLYLATICG